MANAIIIILALSWCSYLAWDTYKTIRRLPGQRRAAEARARRLSDCLEVRP